MTMQLPDGRTLRVEYTGNVPPRISVAKSPLAITWPTFSAFDLGPSFAELQRISAEMERQMDTLMRDAQSSFSIVAPSADNGLYDIKLGDLPPGSMSYSFFSTSNGRTTCSKMVEVTKPGDGAKPKVVSRTSGDCSGTRASAKTDHTSGDSI
jgi:hypothetical protein